MTIQTASENVLRQEVHRLLDTLPLEKLVDLRQYIAFLQYQQQMGSVVKRNKTNPKEGVKTRKRYPTVTVPAARLQKFTQVLQQGYEGDALRDTEDLYK